MKAKPKTTDSHSGQPQSGRIPKPPKQVLPSFWMALSLYSSIPVPQVAFTPVNLRWTMAFFPVVGLFTGVALILLYALSRLIFIPPMLFSVLAILLTLFVSGGIHLDGFCDSCDALFSRKSREEQLAIMKDPHVGSFAMFGCILLLLLQFVLYHLIYTVSSFRTWIALLFLFVLERALSGLSVMILPPARQDGMVHTVVSPAATNVRTVLIAEAAFSALGLLLFGGWSGGAAVIAAALVFMAYISYVSKHFNGTTGDLAGFFLLLCETGQLLAFALVKVQP